MEQWRQAVEAVEQRARDGRPSAEGRLRAVFMDEPEYVSAAVDQFGASGRLTLNFHPDRRTATGTTVAESLRSAGAYLSQYKTGISNGGRTAVPGGYRDLCEQQLFGGAYDAAASGDRPLYGAFDLLMDPHGGSPRFGSSFLVLRDHVRQRVTLCVGDSHAGPRDVGTFNEPQCVLAALAEQSKASALLDRPLGEDAFREALARRLVVPAGRRLDGYVEIQVHGGVTLAEDVEELVLDPSFRRTETGRVLVDAGREHGFAVKWHQGSELDPATVPASFRRRETPDLARRVARADGLVDAAAIGRAAWSCDVGCPSEGGDPEDSQLQQLKYVWHAVVAFGQDVGASATPNS